MDGEGLAWLRGFGQSACVKRILVWGMGLLGALMLHAAAPPRLEVIRRDGAVEVAWQGGTGAGPGLYLVERAAAIPGAWQTVATLATNRWTTLVATQGSAFFRVRVVEEPRGRVEDDVFLGVMGVDEMALLLRLYLPGSITPVAVEVRRVVYWTLDPWGGLTRASALVALPLDPGKPLPLVSYQHGTVTGRDDVPSRLNQEAAAALIMACSGYAVVAPDYLGLGDSPGFHPYHHAASQATTVVDALRAARTSVDAAGVALNGQVFLMGYSQGGYVTLAAQREIETRHAAEFQIAASAPSAGAYDLSGTVAEDFLGGRIPPNPYLYAYVLSAYTRVYGFADGLGALLKAPYDVTVPPLFDGTHDSGAINAALPARPADALKPEVLEAFRTDPEHPIRVALRENDLHRGWVPQSRTRFFHCPGDLDVLPANTQVAYEAFVAAGASRVELQAGLPNVNHQDCVVPALLGTKLWFDALKE